YEGPVRWKPYAVAPASDVADPFAVLSPRTGATYALAQIHVARSEQLLISLQSDASVELFIDSRPALAIDHRRETVPNTRWVAASFTKGWHHLLVKTPDSGDAAFRLSVLTPERAPRAFGTAPGGADDQGRLEV